MTIITLPSGKEIPCPNNTSILEAVQNAHIFMEYSCLKARCRSCIVQISAGEVADISTDLILSEEEKKAGYILACNSIPKTNISLNINEIASESLPQKRTFPCKIQSIKKLSPDVIELELRIPPGNDFNWISGQYLNLKKDSISRSYSIAKSKKSGGHISLLIKKYPGGLMSQYLFETAKINDLMHIEGPLGSFFYRNKQPKRLLFLATGTGIAPIKAILEEFEQTPSMISDTEISLFWGVRTTDDLIWTPHFTQFKFNYIPVLSREKVNNCKTGYVQDIVLNHEIDLLETEVYACGSPEMITDARSKLLNKGLLPHNFYADAFVSSI